MSNARQTAVQALLKVNTQDAFSNLAIDALLENSDLSARDRAFASALFYGALERMITLDYCIAPYCKMPLHKLSPAVLEILRTAVYQMLYMDTIPHSAAVNEAVGLAAKFGKRSAGSLINAVLRAFLRDGGRIPALKGTPTQRLSVEYSCPEWIIEAWLKSYGEENLLGLLNASLGAPPLYLRANTQRITADALLEKLRAQGLDCEMDTPEGCIRVMSAGQLQAGEAYRAGAFHVQDKASQLCALALGAQRGEHILDVCAAPGGKSFTIAQQMGDEGRLFAMDVLPGRVSLIAASKKRLGLRCVIPTLNDAAVFSEKHRGADRVLCDVPCSGLGIIRRKPEIKYKKPETLLNLPEIQYKILETSSRYVKGGGVLLYSTCTLLPQENEAVVARFLAAHPEFEPCALPEAICPDGAHSAVLMPHLHGTDGFFMAKLLRKA